MAKQLEKIAIAKPEVKFIRRLSMRVFDILVNGIASHCPVKIRNMIYKAAGFNLQNCFIARGCYFGSKNIIVKNNAFINKGCCFYFDRGYNDAEIVIGNNCAIAPNVNFYCMTHVVGNSKNRADKTIYKSIYVGDGTWIGANTIILPGVKVGEGCVIGAGSVVIKDCEANYLYAGNPAKKIKHLD